MPQPLPFPLRQELVRRHQQGETLLAIAQSLKAPYPTVRNWWRRYRQAGEAGLHTHYDRCGPQQPKAGTAIQQAALTMKRDHPPWGAGLIRLELAKQFPDQYLPQVRAIQRWFRAAGLQPPRAQRPPMERQRGKEPHEVWEMDAKERFRLADGTGTSVLCLTDEASGALLGATPFPPVSLEPGPAERGAAGAAGAVRAVGAARPHPGG
jgi:transposase